MYLFWKLCQENKLTGTSKKLHLLSAAQIIALSSANWGLKSIYFTFVRHSSSQWEKKQSKQCSNDCVFMTKPLHKEMLLRLKVRAKYTCKLQVSRQTTTFVISTYFTVCSCEKFLGCTFSNLMRCMCLIYADATSSSHLALCTFLCLKLQLFFHSVHYECSAYGFSRTYFEQKFLFPIVYN